MKSSIKKVKKVVNLVLTTNVVVDVKAKMSVDVEVDVDPDDDLENYEDAFMEAAEEKAAGILRRKGVEHVDWTMEGGMPVIDKLLETIDVHDIRMRAQDTE